MERPTTLVGAVLDKNLYHIGQRLRRCFFMPGGLAPGWLVVRIYFTNLLKINLLMSE